VAGYPVAGYHAVALAGMRGPEVIAVYEAERIGRTPQPTRGNLALDRQLHSRPTANTATVTQERRTYPRMF
jgi:hypothetical protein